MGLFDKLKSLVSDDKKDTGTIEIVAPLSGEIVNIEDVPDVVFAEKIVGDGIAIKPAGNKMVAPVDGTIGKIFETNHAFSIESDSGIELFVHFGIDTVELKGEGFKRIAEEGQRVKKGDVVIEFNLPLLEEKAKSTLTPVVISNMDEIKELIKLSGSVTVGETPDHPHQEIIANEQEKRRPRRRFLYPSSFEPQRCWPHVLTPVTYRSKLPGIPPLAA